MSMGHGPSMVNTELTPNFSIPGREKELLRTNTCLFIQISVITISMQQVETVTRRCFHVK